MACPAIGSWWIGWGLQSTVLSAGTLHASARITFELILAAALGLAFLGALIAVAVTAFDVVGSNHEVEADRGERRNRLSVIRRLEAERTRTDEVTATLADLIRFFDAPPRSRDGDPAGIDVAGTEPAISTAAGFDEGRDRHVLEEGNR